jgi:hypothetical protein
MHFILYCTSAEPTVSELVWNRLPIPSPVAQPFDAEVVIPKEKAGHSLAMSGYDHRREVMTEPSRDKPE